MNSHLEEVVRGVQDRYPDELEFLAAVEEVAASLDPVVERKPEYASPRSSSAWWSPSG